MWKFILCSFLFLGWGFYELSGGADFAAPPEKARVAKQLATYDVPEDSTQTAPTLVAAAPSIATPEIDVEVEAQPAAPITQEDVILASSSRPQARSTESEAEAGTGETFTPTVAPAVEVEETHTADLRSVSGNRVNMRGGPSTDFEVLAKLVRGDQVQVLESTGSGWVKLEVVATGQVGWMAERLLTR